MTGNPEPRMPRCLSPTGETLEEALRHVLAAASAGGDNLLEVVLHSSRGPVGVLAEVTTSGTTLELRGLTMFSLEGAAIRGIQSDVRAALAELLVAAGSLGFTQLRVVAERVAGSTSAVPGKQVDRVLPTGKKERRNDERRRRPDD